MELPVKIVTAMKFTYRAGECRTTFSNLDPSVNIVAAAYIKIPKHDYRQTSIMQKSSRIGAGGLCSGRCSCS